MKINVKRDVLVKAVNDVSKAISSKTTLPILTGIKIETAANELSLKGSDADISIERIIPLEKEAEVLVSVEATGAVVVPAKLFGEIIKKLPENEVIIEVKENHLTTIQSGKAIYDLIGWDPSEYPIFPEVKEENSIFLSQTIVKDLISSTNFATATSEARPILTGVCWDLSDKLSCVSTDSYRLSRKNIPLESKISELRAVIPNKSLNEIAKLLDETSENNVMIVFSSQQVLFKSDNLSIYSRLLEGNYPDVKRLIPTEFSTVVKVSSKEFYSAIERASLLASENHVIKLMTNENGTIEISSSTPELGKVQEEVGTSSLTGEQITISFSSKYMKEALKALACEEISLLFTGAMRPFIIKPGEETEVESTLQLILPVRTY